MNIIYLLLALPIISLVQVPSNENQDYPLSYPLRYLYYRLNAKLEINPLLAHLSHVNDPTAFTKCSSRTGPFCPMINGRQFQEIQLQLDELTEKDKQSYRTEKSFLSYRQKLARGIETGEVNSIFMIASEEYKAMDTLIKSQISQYLHKREVNGV